MSKFLKISPVRISVEHYSGERSSDEDERKHIKVIKEASSRYIHAGSIDEVVPCKRTVKDKNDQDTEIDAAYLIIFFEGAAADRGHGAARDRESYFLVDGTAREWLDRIDAALSDPEPEQDDPEYCLNDRGTWQPDVAYVPLDLVKHPDNDKRFMATAASKSTSSLVLSNKGYWCEITLPASE